MPTVDKVTLSVLHVMDPSVHMLVRQVFAPRPILVLAALNNERLISPIQAERQTVQCVQKERLHVNSIETKIKITPTYQYNI